MTKTYYKKENITIWYFLLMLIIGVIIFGYVLVRYFVWQVLPLIIMIITKIVKLSKNNVSPILTLDDSSLTVLNPVLGDKKYLFSDISEIHLNSKSLNGYIKLKSDKKKIRLDSVAIDLIDQQEIANTINAKITK